MAAAQARQAFDECFARERNSKRCQTLRRKAELEECRAKERNSKRCQLLARRLALHECLVKERNSQRCQQLARDVREFEARWMRPQATSNVPGPGSRSGAPGGDDMGIFGFLGDVFTTAVGIGEQLTGVDIPGIGPRRGPVPMGAPVFQPRTLTGPTRCNPPFVADGRGGCVAPTPGPRAAIERFLPGGETGFGDLGQPAVVNTTRRVCQRGSVLDINGFCRDKRTIRNSDRMYPRPRRPLLTGGDLNCIAKASRAASRMKTQTKRLQKLGMLPKPRRAKSG